MNRNRDRLREMGNVLAGMLVVVAGHAHAAPLDLSDTPLYLSTNVEPNVFFLLDDSGSMDWEVLIQGAGRSGLGNGLTFGYYSLPSRTSDYDEPWLPDYPYTINDESGIPGQGVWRLKSSSYNKLYYDPGITYEPWAGTDASNSPLFTDATPGAAISDPMAPTAGTLNLTASITFWNYRWDTGAWYQETIYPAKYHLWTDSDGDGEVDANDAFTTVEIRSANAPFTVPASRSDCGTPSAGATTVSCTYAQEIQNFANWYTYYRKRSYVGRAAIGAVLDGASAIRSGLHVYNRGLRQSILSLASDANKRTLLDALYNVPFPCSAASCPGTPARRGLDAVGQYFMGTSTPILPDADGGACQQNFNIIVTDGYWNGRFVSSAIGNADGDNNTEFDSGPTGPYGDPYGDTQFDFNGDGVIDSMNTTLGDIAMYYYENDLAPSLSNNVPTITGVDEADHQHLVNYGVAFGVVGTLDPFDIRTPGDASDTDPEASGFAWPVVPGDTDTSVDDLWHAAYNSRGEFISATDPEQLTTALDAVLDSIGARTASSSSVALNTGSLSSESLLFQARFNSEDWSGQVRAFEIIESGVNRGAVGGMVWEAGCVLTGGPCPADPTKTYTGQNWNTGREIITYKPSLGRGIPFRWPGNPASPGTTDLDPAQSTALKVNPVNPTLIDSDAVGQDRLEFLRGRKVTGMRERGSVLGDTINSNPVLVGPPAFNYPDSLEAKSYSAFATTYANRTPMLYVGANDGMLHGFEATKSATTGGAERIAYVPSKVYSNLAALTVAEYGSSLVEHRAFVDGSATAGDVFFSNDWRTVLVGTLGNGGQGLFALDVTDPTDFDEANADSLVLWEFTDANDADLGYTYAQPMLVRLHNGKWGVIVSNGYNSTENRGGSDTSISSTGNAVLYILDVSNGSVMAKFDTGVGTAEDPSGGGRPNGMARPSPVDLDGDRIVDYIYAPDLFGNVWKIDVRAATAGAWDFDFRSGTNPTPLFVARDASGDPLPITSQVEVALHPTLPGQMLYFGTGKFIERGDDNVTGEQTQAFFGIWDRNEGAATPSDIRRQHLLKQEIIAEQAYTGGTTTDVRLTTRNLITWHLTGGLPTSGGGKLGWYMDLLNTGNGNTDNAGERMVADPALLDGQILFITLLPSENPCEFGGDSWIMALDGASGQRLDVTPFDLDGDGLFNTSDLVDYPSGGSTVSGAVGGVKSGEGIISSPSTLKDTQYGGSNDGIGRRFSYGSGSQGGIDQRALSRSGLYFGRQSWREIFEN